MSSLDSPRTPPQLGPEFKGSLASDYDFDHKTIPILDTYSPFPTFGSRDPFGLDAFLLHPHDAVWEYLQPTSIPGEQLPESDRPKYSKESGNRRSMLLRRSSPLSAPPLLSDDDEGKDASLQDPAAPPRPTSRRPVSMTIGTKGLRALVGRKASPTTSSDSPDYTPDDEEELTSRPTSMASLVSSGSSSDGSCEGLKTPGESSAPLDVTARLTAALQEDERKASSTRGNWRGWLGSKRTSFLGMRGGETGTTLLESPRASVVDLAPEVPDAGPTGDADNDATRSAAVLRRASLVKLGSLRMPSAHPLAAVLARQLGDLPNEVAFSIPATKRVYPMSVNLLKNTTELAPAQGGLRVALGLRNIIHKIDAGERPNEPFLSRRAPPSQKTMRARGVRDFVSRAPFEERMVVYSSDAVCSEVSTARPGYAIWEIEISDYIQALALAEEMPPALTSPPSPARSGPPPPRRTPVLRVVNPTEDVPPADKAAEKPVSAPVSSFRNARRPRPQTWEDSSDEEEDEPKSEDETATKRVSPAPARPATKRTTTAPARMRESKVMDAHVALDMLARARERRVEFNSGEVERRAGAAEERRKSMMASTSARRASAPSTSLPKPTATADRRMPTRRQSTMTLSTHKVVDRTERPAMTHRASSYTLNQVEPTGQRTPPKQARPPASLPASPRLKSQLDGRRVVSTYDPQLAHRASMIMYPQHTGYQPPGMYATYSVQVPMYPQSTGIAPYHPQFPHASPSMYFHPQAPATGRRRERPVA